MTSRFVGYGRLVAKARTRLFSISPQEATFARRGFAPGDPVKQARFERIGMTFVAGYNAAMELDRDLAASLDATDPEYRGFAYEGAAMALTLLDSLTLGDRFRRFLLGPGDPHAYMLHVGAGWAIARLPWLRLRLDRALESYDPLLRWLAVDGYGFHEGYFHGSGAADLPLSGYARRAFDQGLGRCMWFACCADPERVVRQIAGLDAARHSDLWAGIGLAAAYAGGHTGNELDVLLGHSGEHAASLAQGAAFAAKARLRAGNPVRHTDAACQAFCGMSAADAAAVTDLAFEELPGEGTAYERWRRRIQMEFSAVRK